MPGSNVQEYIDTPPNRLELADFLKKTGDLPANGCTWEDRLAHWWDDNPHAAMHPLRGYLVRDEGKLVGYGGAIPMSYALEGQRIPALVATTLRIADGHVQCGLNILLKMRHLGQEVPFVHTTPVPKLQEVLRGMGARSDLQITRRLVPIGTWARLLPGGSGWPALDPSMRVITSVNDVTGLADRASTPDQLEPFVSFESLCWQLTTPLHDLQLLGAVDVTGQLHSFLILRRRERTLRALVAWEVVQSWTARETPDEVQALVGALARDPGLLGERLSWLTTTAFPNDTHWRQTPRLMEHQEAVCHYFLLPGSCRDATKLSMLAEGDLLL